MNEQKLYQLIFSRLKQEDKDLDSLVEQGLFFVPELYVAIILGKEIKKNELDLFGESLTWEREISLEGEGPSDFVFKSMDQTFVFELKLRDTYYAYDSDINKLKKLKDPKYVKYFIAVIDAWGKDRENDGRIIEIEKRHPDMKRISEINSFDTKQIRYAGDICCTLGIWKIDGH